MTDQHVHSVVTCPTDVEGPTIMWLCGHEPASTPRSVPDIPWIRKTATVKLLTAEVEYWKTRCEKAQTAAGLSEFHRKDAGFWRDRAEKLGAALREIEARAEFLTAGVNAPPEPPVGTGFYRKGHLVWEHQETGWVCCRENCENCPETWVDTWDWIQNHDLTRVIPGDPVPADLF